MMEIRAGSHSSVLSTRVAEVKISALVEPARRRQANKEWQSTDKCCDRNKYRVS